MNFQAISSVERREQGFLILHFHSIVFSRRGTSTVPGPPGPLQLRAAVGGARAGPARRPARPHWGARATVSDSGQAKFTGLVLGCIDAKSEKKISYRLFYQQK